MGSLGGLYPLKLLPITLEMRNSYKIYYIRQNSMRKWFGDSSRE
jgi:hypothetical protein